MIIEEIKNLPAENKVIRISEVDKNFEELYLQSRKKEKRLYSDEEVKLLPYASDRNPHKNEWALRTRSFLRFKNYLSNKKQNLNILDLGCGNCWFTGQMSKEFDHNYFCVDVNLNELEQAARVFKSDKMTFIYGDIFTAALPAGTFDLIVLNSVVQYFSNFSNLVKELFFIMKSYGEIHIMDSPFYNRNEIHSAKNRTFKYYTSTGFPEMTKNYFHHTFEDLKYLNHKLLYNPNSLKNRIKSIVLEQDSPFPWIVISK